MKSCLVSVCLALSLSPAAFAALDTALAPLPAKPFSQWQSLPEIKPLLVEFKQASIAPEKDRLLHLGLNMDKIDFEAVFAAFSATAEAPNQVRVPSVKANMHTLQTMIETYAVDWGGVYPSTLAGLSREARVSGRNYWKPFLNPVTKGRGIGPRGAMIDIAEYTGTPDQAGLVVYEPIISGNHYYYGKDSEYIVKYYIYSVAEDGSFTPERNKPKQPFILSNS